MASTSSDAQSGTMPATDIGTVLPGSAPKIDAVPKHAPEMDASEKQKKKKKKFSIESMYRFDLGRLHNKASPKPKKQKQNSVPLTDEHLSNTLDALSKIIGEEHAKETHDMKKATACERIPSPIHHHQVASRIATTTSESQTNPQEILEHSNSMTSKTLLESAPQPQESTGDLHESRPQPDETMDDSSCSESDDEGDQDSAWYASLDFSSIFGKVKQSITSALTTASTINAKAPTMPETASAFCCYKRSKPTRQMFAKEPLKFRGY